MLYILSSICSITTGIKALSVLSIFALPSTFSSNSRTARIDRLSKKGKDLEDKRTCGVAYLSFPGKIMLFLPGQRSVRADTNNRLRSGMLPFPTSSTSFNLNRLNEANVRFNYVGRAAARIKL